MEAVGLRSLEVHEMWEVHGRGAGRIYAHMRLTEWVKRVILFGKGSIHKDPHKYKKYKWNVTFTYTNNGNWSEQKVLIFLSTDFYMSQDVYTSIFLFVAAAT